MFLEDRADGVHGVPRLEVGVGLQHQFGVDLDHLDAADVLPDEASGKDLIATGAGCALFCRIRAPSAVPCRRRRMPCGHAACRLARPPFRRKAAQILFTPSIRLAMLIV